MNREIHSQNRHLQSNAACRPPLSIAAYKRRKLRGSQKTPVGLLHGDPPAQSWNRAPAGAGCRAQKIRSETAPHLDFQEAGSSMNSRATACIAPVFERAS